MLIKPSLNNILWLISAAALGKYMKGYKIKTRLMSCEDAQSMSHYPVVNVEHCLFGIAGPNSTLIYGHAVPQTLSVQLCVTEEFHPQWIWKATAG